MTTHPTDLRYSDKHVWARPGEPHVPIGVTAHRTEQLGTVSFVELPYPGELYRPGQIIGRVASATGSAPVYMPFVGQVMSVNSALPDNPGLVSDDPYGEGWIVRVELHDPTDAEQLMDAEAYEAHVSAAAG